MVANLSGITASLAMKFASIHPEVMVSFGIVRQVDCDYGRPAGIPDDVG